MDTDKVKARWHGFEPLFTKLSAFAPGFDPEESGNVARENLENARVLVVGAGGLGCELLKLLALSGFTDIFVIDLDTIDISNLNRQFLFRREHVDKYKAQVASEHIRKKYPHVKVEWDNKKLQEFPKSWFKRFNVVIAGLDNVEARRWLNATLNELVQFDSDGNPQIDTIIPLIDGGTEGLRGQARVFLPKLTSCFECSLDSMPATQAFNHCTIANVPRIPEHCIQYAHEILWPRLEELDEVTGDFKLAPVADGDSKPPNKIKFNSDKPAHMTWVFKQACERAVQYKITSPTYKLTMQVVKHIIPSVASTNAVIAAQCVLEAVKVVTFFAPNLDNFMLFNGVSLQGCALHKYAQKENCAVCSKPIFLKISPASTLHDLRQTLINDNGIENPDVTWENQVLYLSRMDSTYGHHLSKPLSALITQPKPSGNEVVVTSGKMIHKVLLFFS